MKIRLLLLLFMVFALFVAVPDFVAAGVVKIAPPVDRRILVTAVDLKAGTVQFRFMRDARQPRPVYTIDSMTDLKVDNVRDTIDKIKPGMQVRDYVERDGHTLDKLYVGAADSPPSPSSR